MTQFIAIDELMEDLILSNNVKTLTLAVPLPLHKNANMQICKLQTVLIHPLHLMNNHDCSHFKPKLV